MDVTTFQSIFPQFASEGSTRVQFFLNLAANEMDQTAWGALFDAGQGYLAAHLLSVANMSASGAVSSRKTDELQISYRAPGGDSALSLTPYGAQYLELLHSLPSAVGFCVGGF